MEASAELVSHALAPLLHPDLKASERGSILKLLKRKHLHPELQRSCRRQAKADWDKRNRAKVVESKRRVRQSTSATIITLREALVCDTCNITLCTKHEAPINAIKSRRRVGRPCKDRGRGLCTGRGGTLSHCASSICSCMSDNCQTTATPVQPVDSGDREMNELGGSRSEDSPQPADLLSSL